MVHERLPRKFSRLSLAAILAAASSVIGEEAGTPPDKSGYSFFHPAPREFMRELTTDRPDKTEGPFTVDAGHFQRLPS